MPLPLHLSLLAAAVVAVWADCPTGFTEYVKMCYYHPKITLGFHDAEKFCNNAAPDGHLASVDTEARNRYLYKLIEKTRMAYFGLFRRKDEVVLHYTDGTPLNYSNWYPLRKPFYRPGMEECVVMLGPRIHDSLDGRWVGPWLWGPTTSCNDKLPFLCSASATPQQ